MDFKEIERLVELVENAAISQLSLDLNGTKIAIKKELYSAPTSSVVHVAAAPAASQAPTQPASVAAPAPESDAGLVPIKSQMVGTFYASSSPDSAPYVKVGDRIKSGQVICIVEAMKLFNEIESDQAGVVEKICVPNGSPVEFGQPLFLIRPE